MDQRNNSNGARKESKLAFYIGMAVLIALIVWMFEIVSRGETFY